MGRVVDSGRVLAWRGRLARYRGSGLTVGRFCSREGVSVASFYYWRQRLGEEKVAMPDSRRGEFVPVRVLGAASVSASASVSVFLPGGTRLEIPMAEGQGLADTLRAVLEADASRGGGT